MRSKLTISIFTLFVFFALATAHTSYRGYSGAPGSSGRCASSCHGSGGGTIQVTGFPEEYQPGETYEISITHAGGSSIRQFNGSCRIGTGSQNAGEIAGGHQCATYNVNSETNGIHLTTSSQDSATFNWTAPESGTGEVRLYIAGLQGSYSGQNSTITLISDESQTAIDEPAGLPSEFGNIANYPNPFNAQTTISFDLASNRKVTIDLFNINGQHIQTLLDAEISAGSHQVNWDATNFASGLYFYKISAGNKTISKCMTLLK